MYFSCRSLRTVKRHRATSQDLRSLINQRSPEIGVIFNEQAAIDEEDSEAVTIFTTDVCLYR